MHPEITPSSNFYQTRDTTQERAHMYFGIPVSNKHDKEYESAVRGIGYHTDTCIFFAVQIVKRLRVEGIEMRKEFKLPKVLVREFQFVDENAAALMPSGGEFSVWEERLSDGN